METIDQTSTIIVPPSSSKRPALPAAQPPQGGSLIQALATAAADPRCDMDKMERLFVMHKQLIAMDAEKAFNDAMARAQHNMVPVITNRDNTHTSSRYANLAAIAKAIRPLYTGEGLSLSFDSNRQVLNADGKPIDPPRQGWFRTVGIVSHSAGYSRLHHIDLPSDDVGVKGTTNKTPIQGVVSMTTYGRRVLECMVFNVSTEDDDGNAPKGKDKNAGTEKEPAGKPPYPNEHITNNLPAWKKLVAAGTKTADQVIKNLLARYTLTDEQTKRIRTAIAPTTTTEEPKP